MRKRRNSTIMLWFLPSCFLLQSCLLNNTDNFYVELASSFLHSLSTCCHQLGLACGVPELTGGMVHAHMAIHIFLQNRFCPSEKALALGRSHILCLNRETFLQDADYVVLWVYLSPLGQAGGALTLCPATLEHWEIQRCRRSSHKSTHSIPPFLDIQFY